MNVEAPVKAKEKVISSVNTIAKIPKNYKSTAEIKIPPNLVDQSLGQDRRVGPHRVRLERELARIYELELGDLPRALAAITRAVQHATDDRELLDEVMRLGLMSGDLVTVSDTYEDVCEATDNALELCDGVDLLIHDAQYTPQEHPHRLGWGHSTWQVAAEVAARSRVKQLVLTSHDPGRSDVEIDRLAKEASEIFKNTTAAFVLNEYDGACYDPAPNGSCSCVADAPTVVAIGAYDPNAYVPGLCANLRVGGIGLVIGGVLALQMGGAPHAA